MSKYTIGPLFQQDFPVSQNYGERPEYYSQFGLAGHEGVDFATPNGTPFISPLNGIILRDTLNDKDYGNFTVIWDPVQLCGVWFCHLQDMTTQVGDKVVKGQLLGHTNNTGNSSGPHCHVNFVETDSQGNRLNRNNGYQGFLNLLDSNLVSIVSQTSTDPVETLPKYFTTLLQENSLDLNNEGQIREFFQKAIDYPNIENNLTSTSQKLATTQSDLVTAQSIIGSLQNQLNNPPVPDPTPTPPIIAPTGTGAILETGFIGWLRRLLG